MTKTRRHLDDFRGSTPTGPAQEYEGAAVLAPSTAATRTVIDSPWTVPTKNDDETPERTFRRATNAFWENGEGSREHVRANKIAPVVNCTEKGDDATKRKPLDDASCIKMGMDNTFWVFVLGSVLGLALETLYVLALQGKFEDRAGLLFGPFSPLYGCAAVILTLLGDGMKDRPIIIIFAICALVGGSLEYITSWFLQTAFGIAAWDYTGSWLSIDGRTNGSFMILWGLLGLAWTKVLIPFIARYGMPAIKKIDHRFTLACTAFMIVDIALTVSAIDCWFMRESGDASQTGIQLLCGEIFDNDFMANRFQTMSIDADLAARP